MEKRNIHFQNSHFLNQQRWLHWLTLLGLWLIPVIFSTNQIYFRFQTTGKNLIWINILGTQIVLWAVWAMLSPFIVWLGNRFPINKKQWPLNLTIHLFISTLFAMGYIAFYAIFVGYIRQILGWQWLIGNYVDFLTLRFSFDFGIYWLILGISYSVNYYKGFRRFERLVQKNEFVTQQKPAPTKAQNFQNVDYPSRLGIKSVGQIYFIKVAEIDWIEAADQYARIHCNGKTHLKRESLKSLEKKLDPHRFYRIHRSTIVNADQIRELQAYHKGDYLVILKNGTTLKLSRYRRNRLANLFA